MTVEAFGEIEYTRGRDFFDPERAEQEALSVTIVGCGGIGSFAAHALAKLGVPKLTLVDFDVVEAHNVPNQFYEIADVGDTKVDALAGHLTATTKADVGAVPYRVTEDGWETYSEAQIYPPSMHGIVVAALDSMEARVNLWKQVRHNPQVQLYIDGRLGGQSIVVYTVNPLDVDDVAGYEATLHSDDEGLDQPCTGRNIIDVGYAMAALITRQVRVEVEHSGHGPRVIYQDQESLVLGTSEWLL